MAYIIGVIVITRVVIACLIHELVSIYKKISI